MPSVNSSVAMRSGLEAYRRLLGAIGFEVLCLLTRRDPHDFNGLPITVGGALLVRNLRFQEIRLPLPDQ
jgi:hypothetical protein